MLLLTSPADRLQIITSAAAIINVHTSWVDTDTGAGTITPGRTNTAVSAAATTNIAGGGPAAGVQRNVKTANIRNADATLPCDITVQHTDGTVAVQLYKRTLSPGDMLEYSDQAGFAWTTASGASGGGAGGGGSGFTTGDIRPTFKNVPDAGWIIADDGSIGNAASNATNRANADTQALFALFWNNIAQTVAPNRTCTISIATPAVITLATHGFAANQQVVFTTTGALPTGITAGTVYYVMSTGLTAGAFQISGTSGGAAINTSGTQSGTQQVAGFIGLVIQDSAGNVVVRGATAAADYAANRRLVLPAMAGRAFAAAGAGGGLAVHALGDTLGAETVAQTVAQLASHNHQAVNGYGEDTGGITGYYAAHYELQNMDFSPGQPNGMLGVSIRPAGGGAPMNNIQPTVYVNYMVKL
jgi:microcystin-dependent protein